MGKLVANDADSYRYLAESIRMHPDQDSLKAMVLNAGFARCEVHNFTGGIVALHKGGLKREFGRNRRWPARAALEGALNTACAATRPASNGL